jgi:hypothetical protein
LFFCSSKSLTVNPSKSCTPSMSMPNSASEIPVYGEQENSAYNGHLELLLPEIERQQKLGKEVVFRADAAFAKSEIYEALGERGVKYAIRIPANDSLERDIAELLTRPVGRPSYKPVVWYKSFLSSSELEDGAPSGGQGGVPLWGNSSRGWDSL